MSEKYRIALAYSNIQKDKDVPTMVAGVICYEDDYQELLRRDLPKKKSLIKRVDSLSGLQDTFQTFRQYLTDHLVIPVRSYSSLASIENVYTKALYFLRSSHLHTISGKIISINIRSHSTYDKQSKTWKTVPFSEAFLNIVKGFSHNYQVFNDEFDPLLEIAKILSRLEYERRRYFGRDSIISVIKKKPSAYNQIIRMKWTGTSILDYYNDRIAPPAIILRGPDNQRLQYLYLEKGMNFDFQPLNKFCRGWQDDQDVLPCQYSNKNNPFGLPLSGSFFEQCPKCKKSSEYAICLYRKPLCTGQEILCGNSKFAGHICCGLFGLYITRFADELKVGTAVLSNVIGRLLEQGVSTALILYPIEGIMNAHILEKIVRDYLDKRIEEFHQYGINHAYRQGPPSEEKINDFLTYWDRTDVELMEKVMKAVSELQSNIGDYEIDLGKAEYKVCTFLDNYLRPTSSDYSLQADDKLPAVKGKLVGYRGSFLFLDSGHAIDIREHNGYVIRGQIG